MNKHALRRVTQQLTSYEKGTIAAILSNTLNSRKSHFHSQNLKIMVQFYSKNTSAMKLLVFLAMDGAWFKWITSGCLEKVV